MPFIGHSFYFCSGSDSYGMIVVWLSGCLVVLWFSGLDVLWFCCFVILFFVVISCNMDNHRNRTTTKAHNTKIHWFFIPISHEHESS